MDSDGPVVNVVNNRIRNLKKKLNRIARLEQSLIITKEQEQLIDSKTSIVAIVDELEKLRQPLRVAVEKEISFAVKHYQVLGSENESENKDMESVNEKELFSADEDLFKLIYDDDNDGYLFLGETEWDLISLMTSMLISKSEDSSSLRQNALQRCLVTCSIY